MNWIKNQILGLQELPEELVWLQRRETWFGEVKTNAIRSLFLFVFLLNELINFHLLHVVDKKFHIGSLLIGMIWIIATLNFQWILKNHWFPRTYLYFMPAIDLLLTTFLLLLADGPKSALVSLYFLIIVLSGLRLNPREVYFSVLAACLGYISVFYFAQYQKPEFAVPLYHGVIVILSLGFEGIVISHLIGRMFELLAPHSQKNKVVS